MENSLPVFYAGDVEIKPIIFYPFFDTSEFDTTGWDLMTATFITTSYSGSGNYFNGYNSTGNSQAFSESDLKLNPTWIISYTNISCSDGSPLPEGPFAKCYCVQTNPTGGSVGQACQLSGSTTGDGQVCSRANIWGNCTGVCRAGPSQR